MRAQPIRFLAVLAVLTTSLGLTACAPMQRSPQYSNNPNCQNNTNVAAGVAGALVGGLVGSRFGQGGGQTAATIAGVTGGALLGNSLGCQ